MEKAIVGLFLKEEIAMSEEKLSSGTPPQNAYKFNSASMRHIYGFLTDRELIELQPVAKAWRQPAVQAIEKVVKKAKLIGVNEKNRKGVWVIHQCLKDLKYVNDGSPIQLHEISTVPKDPYKYLRKKLQAPLLDEETIKEIEKEVEYLQNYCSLPFPFNFLEHIHLIPELPAETLAKISVKRYLQDLNDEEIHFLFILGDLDGHLLRMCRYDPEKASLVMENSYLKRHLRENEKRRHLTARWFNKIGGALFTGIGGFILALIVSVMALSVSIAAFVMSPIVLLANMVFDGSSASSIKNLFKAFLAYPFISAAYLLIRPLYCLFAGSYYGGKYGIYEPNALSSINDLELEPSLYQFFSVFKIPEHWRPYPTVADIATQAERLQKKDKIAELAIGTALTAPFPAKSSPPKTYQTETTAYTPLKSEEKVPADYGSGLSSP
jgi:hypothetical protein